MKKLLLGLMMLFAFNAFAQSTHTIDFEPAGVGAGWDWTVAENADNPPLEFIANPVSSGINTSATVAKFTARVTGQPWALCFTDDDGEFTFDATNSTVTIMVYKTVISDVGFKVEGLSGNHQIIISNTVTNQWEELTFDFATQIGNTYSRLVIIPDFDMAGRTQENIIYFDNIQVPDGVVTGPLPEPTTVPPIPPHAAADVISIYSDTYTDIPGTDFNPNWGQSTTVTVDYIAAGNNTLKYENLNYQGTQFASALDVSGYENLHVDFWTPNSTDLGIFMISTGPIEIEYLLVPPGTTESWQSLDIPLTAFAGINLADVIQFKVDGNGTIYFDNWYFWKSPASTVWTGSVDNNWHDAGNWDNGIPGSASDVTIPSGLTNYPTISAAASCNNITLVSDAVGTATLVDNGYLTVNGTATVQRYYPTGGTTFEEWHLISSPVSDAQANVYSGYYVQWYQEATTTWFDVVSLTDPLTSLQGFAFWAPNDGMSFDYVGTMGDGPYVLPISASGPVPEHWNLFGNPYPSTLDWDLVSPANLANLQSGAVYYLDQATGAYVSYNGGMGGGSRYVPSGQGFFVSGANDGAPFTVDNTMRSHAGGSTYYKADFDNLLVLTAEGNDYSDVTYLRFDEEATVGIDKQFDAYKILAVSNPNLPLLYTVGGDKLSINVLPQAEMITYRHPPNRAVES